MELGAGEGDEGEATDCRKFVISFAHCFVSCDCDSCESIDVGGVEMDDADDFAWE